MKKAAVITVSVILFVILLGVNYLLWDNSSKKEDIQELETQEESKQKSLDQVYRDLFDEQKENDDLKAQIHELENTINDKQIEIDTLATEKMDIYTIIGDKNTIISQLKKSADITAFQIVLDEWIDNIVNKDYFGAYSGHNEKDIFNNRSDIMFTRYGEIFDNIEFMETEAFSVRLMDGEDSIDEEAKNRIVFDVLLNIELIKDEDGFPISDVIFKNGINHFKVTMSFDMNRWQWILWTIE